MATVTSLARRLRARRQGANWRLPCPRGCGYSLSLRDGADGRLLAFCHGGCEYNDILPALIEAGLLDDDSADQYDGRDYPIDQHRDDAQRIAQARLIYDSGVWNALIALYLRSRAISLVSPLLRFNPTAPHRIGARLPAMLAPVVDLAGQQTGVHLTYLRHDGSGKADLPSEFQRETRGVIRGGAIRLAPHDGGTELVIGEGIETTLSAMQLFGRPGWSAVYAGGLKTLGLPPEVRHIVIAADNDTTGAGQRAALIACERWTAEGRQVAIKLPPTPGDDFNAVLAGEGLMTGADKGEFDADIEALKRQFWGDPGTAAPQAQPNGADTDATGWPYPDLEVLRLRRRPPPALPLNVFGDAWGSWISGAATAAACPADYVALPLLAVTSTLVGNARWAQAAPGWSEPPHLWLASVGDSGDGKSPGSDCLMRDVVPEIEDRMLGDFPERHQEWRAAVAFDKAAEKRWENEQRAAVKEGKPFDKPLPKPTVSDVEPQRPCLRHNDITVEEVAAVLATAAPKGVVIIRDELAGWLDSMTAYNPAGRAFWLEAYGGRPYRVGRRKHSGQPINIQYLVVAVYGGTQPDRLVQLIDAVDDGLLARLQWAWPEPVPFHIGEKPPNAPWAIYALDKLRELELALGDPPSPILVPLVPEGRDLIEEFGRDMQAQRENAGGLLRSAYGKARGTALRLSLVLEWLWWCGLDGMALPPTTISMQALAAAMTLVADYFMPMAERVFGDAAATDTERMAATLARWIVKQQPDEIHVRHLQREVRLPGVRSAEQIKKAADALVEADWLRAPMKGFGPQSKVSYAINPKLAGVSI